MIFFRYHPVLSWGTWADPSALSESRHCIELKLKLGWICWFSCLCRRHAYTYCNLMQPTPMKQVSLWRVWKGQFEFVPYSIKDRLSLHYDVLFFSYLSSLISYPNASNKQYLNNFYWGMTLARKEVNLPKDQWTSWVLPNLGKQHLIVWIIGLMMHFTLIISGLPLFFLYWYTLAKRRMGWCWILLNWMCMT